MNDDDFEDADDMAFGDILDEAMPQFDQIMAGLRDEKEEALLKSIAMWVGIIGCRDFGVHQNLMGILIAMAEHKKEEMDDDQDSPH
jgi:hypothetical protein